MSLDLQQQIDNISTELSYIQGEINALISSLGCKVDSNSTNITTLNDEIAALDSQLKTYKYSDS